MRSTLSRIDDPHDAPIAPDIVPADWADCVPRPANDALSREKLFAEIRHAAETSAPAVDNTFRATDVNDTPALKKKSASRAWLKRAAMVFTFALVSAMAAAAWQHHGDTALQTAANLVGATSSPATDAQATEQTAEAAALPAADQPTDTAQTASSAALPPEAEQQIQSMARDLAAMGQQIEQLKATIQQLKANQQAAVAPAPPVARPPAAKPAQPKVTALPPRPAIPPAAQSPRPAYPPAVQAAAVPPPAATAPFPPPPQPQQATTQPNGEPVVRPPMPMPLSDRY